MILDFVNLLINIVKNQAEKIPLTEFEGSLKDFISDQKTMSRPQRWSNTERQIVLQIGWGARDSSMKTRVIPGSQTLANGFRGP